MTRNDTLRIQRAMLTVPGVTLPRYGADGSIGAEFWTAFDEVIRRAGGKTAQAGQPYEVTERVALEILHHEAIVREAYKDSVDVWTWGVGQTAASGINPLDYKDKPAELRVVLAAFVKSLRDRYVPPVVSAFRGAPLTEAQFAAALSFHYNTGAIGRASWVQYFLAGATETVQYQSFMDWRKPAAIIPRREAEANLLFYGTWSQDGTVAEYPVLKPSYSPDWRKVRRIDVTDALRDAMSQ